MAGQARPLSRRDRRPSLLSRKLPPAPTSPRGKAPETISRPPADRHTRPRVPRNRCAEDGAGHGSTVEGAWSSRRCPESPSASLLRGTRGDTSGARGAHRGLVLDREMTARCNQLADPTGRADRPAARGRDSAASGPHGGRLVREQLFQQHLSGHPILADIAQQVGLRVGLVEQCWYSARSSESVVRRCRYSTSRLCPRR